MKHTTTELDELLKDVEKMIYKCAWRAADRYRLPFDECLSECYWDFVRATNWRFQEERGVKFSTFLQYLIQRHFQTLLRKQILNAEQYPSVELNEETAGLAAPQTSPCLEAVEGMSQEAKEIVELLLDTPGELLNVWEPCNPKELLRRVKGYLRRKGRCHKKLEAAHQEIETTFRGIWAEAVI